MSGEGALLEDNSVCITVSRQAGSNAETDARRRIGKRGIAVVVDKRS